MPRHSPHPSAPVTSARGKGSGASGPDLPDLVNAAIGGSNDAWNALVQRFAPLVSGVALRHRLSQSDADDVAQTVWLRLVEHLADLREPRALPGWIVTTTRHEALRVVSARSRVEVVDPQADIRLHSVDNDDVATNLLLAERRRAVRAGLANLQDPQRELLLLTADPENSYRQISQHLGIPTGSIGPTRARCLKKLRDTTALRALAS